MLMWKDVKSGSCQFIVEQTYFPATARTDQTLVVDGLSSPTTSSRCGNSFFQVHCPHLHCDLQWHHGLSLWILLWEDSAHQGKSTIVIFASDVEALLLYLKLYFEGIVGFYACLWAKVKAKANRWAFLTQCQQVFFLGCVLLTVWHLAAIFYIKSWPHVCAVPRNNLNTAK